MDAMAIYPSRLRWNRNKLGNFVKQRWQWYNQQVKMIKVVLYAMHWCKNMRCLVFPSRELAYDQSYSIRLRENESVTMKRAEKQTYPNPKTWSPLSWTSEFLILFGGYFQFSHHLFHKLRSYGSESPKACLMAITLPKTDIAPARTPWQKKIHLPTQVIQVLC